MGSRSHPPRRGGKASPPTELRLDERPPDYGDLLSSLSEAQAHLQEAELAIVRLERAALVILRTDKEGSAVEGSHRFVSGTAEFALFSAEKCRRVLLRLGVQLDQARAHRDRWHPKEARAEELEHARDPTLKGA